MLIFRTKESKANLKVKTNIVIRWKKCSKCTNELVSPHMNMSTCISTHMPSGLDALSLDSGMAMAT